MITGYITKYWGLKFINHVHTERFPSTLLCCSCAFSAQSGAGAHQWVFGRMSAHSCSLQCHSAVPCMVAGADWCREQGHWFHWAGLCLYTHRQWLITDRSIAHSCQPAGWLFSPCSQNQCMRYQVRIVSFSPRPFWAGIAPLGSPGRAAGALDLLWPFAWQQEHVFPNALPRSVWWCAIYLGILPILMWVLGGEKKFQNLHATF